MSTKTLELPPDELIARWETIAKKHDGSTAETITHHTPLETFERHNTMGTLPRIGDDKASEFDIKTTLGKGGMGLVRLARQRSLWRDVAIKTILPERLEDESVNSLLRESWVTGILEHPNIIPIYALGVDENNAPMLVMKQIEGVNWREAFTGEADMPATFRSGGDELEDNLQILLQVCNAVQFAHSKGIVHCDLKPENIMLGDYGEVYLLDWGIAVTVEDDETGRLPQAEEVTSVCGTPSYIAPELAEGVGSRISERTDVYLLGAILHRLITGEARHEGETVMAMLINAYKSAPVDYDDTVPRELAAISNMATSADPNQRFQSVEAFREAILGFLQHRDSRRLSGEARQRLERLESEIDALDDPANIKDDDAISEIYRLFAECRFGFEQALTVWQQNQDARDGLHHALRRMVDFELRHRDAKAAAVLLDELPDAEPEFKERLADLRRELAREADEIQRNKRFIRDVDISLASRQRSIMCLILGFLFGGAPLVVQLFVSQGWAELTFPAYFTQYAVVLTGSLLVVGLMRKRLFKNAVNAQLIAALFTILGGCLIMRVLGYLMGLDPGGCIVLEQGIIAFGIFMLAISLDRRLWFAGAVFLAAAIAAGFFPEYVLPLDGVSNAAGFWIIAFVWRGSKTSAQPKPH